MTDSMSGSVRKDLVPTQWRLRKICGVGEEARSMCMDGISVTNGCKIPLRGGELNLGCYLSIPKLRGDLRGRCFTGAFGAHVWPKTNCVGRLRSMTLMSYTAGG
uniref:Uncharacterized protein n=1 Tax=Proboscia inermis TaxID=420281 RepID=A0A6T8LY99_9STRA|mmetsp:Transcript_40149/g.40789  ORF Transcript_40149/g.40789 Transcript_40149/m.40789 type:complete len:104 (+) Transcript_40149:53-364(+)